MKASTGKLFILLLIVAFQISLVAQQETTTSTTSSGSSGGSSSGNSSYIDDPASQYSEADRPEDNYLAKFHALDKVEKLSKENLELIFTLNVIKENFKGSQSAWNDDYEKIYAGYKDAMNLSYRRQVIYAAVKLEENKKKINELYQKISDEYRKNTLEMLNLCADHILQLSLKASTASNPNSNLKLSNNINRLRTAYGQVDDADRARTQREYAVSVFHFRVAKSYAIAILEDINPDEYLTESGESKYKIDKADNKNRIISDRQTNASEVRDRRSDLQTQNRANEQPETMR